MLQRGSLIFEYLLNGNWVDTETRGHGVVIRYDMVISIFILVLLTIIFNHFIQMFVGQSYFIQDFELKIDVVL